VVNVSNVTVNRPGEESLEDEPAPAICSDVEALLIELLVLLL